MAPSLQDTITQTPPTFESVISQSPNIQPFLTDTASLLTQLDPGIRTLQTTAPPLTEVFRTGTQNLPQTIPFDRELTAFSKTLGRVAVNPAVLGGVGSLSYTAKHLQAPLSFLTPVQSTCNYVTLFLRNIAESASEHVGNAGFLDVLPLTIKDCPGPNLSSSPALLQAVYRASLVHPRRRLRRPAARRSLPEYGVARPAPRVLRRQRGLRAGNALVGNPTATSGSTTEKTTRGGSS